MQKSKNNKVGGKRITEISKALSYLLRHGAIENNLKMDTKGYALLSDVVNSQPIKKHKASKEMIYQVVAENNKKRFELLTAKNGLEYIRAVQGHTMETVKNEEALDLIQNIYEFPTILHGTYFEPWEFIKNTGLNKMSRNTIHFAIGENKDNNVISGMRGNCELYVEINGPLCVANGIQMFISKNKVVLSPGNNGVIDTSFFKRVISTNGNLISSCEYDQVILPLLKVTDIKTFGLPDQTVVSLSKILLINLKTLELKEEIDLNLCLNDENRENMINKLNEFSTKFIEKGHNKIPTILILSKNAEKLFTDYMINITKVRKDSDFIKHPSLYSEYIIFDIDYNHLSNNSDILNEEKLKYLIKLL
jgi:2'-phosphotransferase